MTPQTPETPGTAPRSFDDALRALEDVVRRLEGGQIELEEAITLFEEGHAHLAVCRERLEAARGRIEDLTQTHGASGGMTLMGDPPAADA